MSAETYLRRIAIGFALIVALAVLPFALAEGVLAVCDGRRDCTGAAAMVFVMLGMIPARIAILAFIGLTAYRRLRALELSVGYSILICLLLVGCFRSSLFAGTAVYEGHLRWEVVAPPLLTAMILASIPWVPEARVRGILSPWLRYSLIVVSAVLLLRLATEILFPLWLIPGLRSFSNSLTRIADWGPLRLIPDPWIILAFAAIFLMALRQWRDPNGRASTL